MGAGEWAMRMSPTRTTIVMRKNPLDLKGNYDETPNHEFKRHQNAGMLATDQIGMIQESGDTEFGADVLLNEYGRPIVDREITTLPDPRYNNKAHCVFGCLWYGGCLLAILYITWLFVVYEVEQYYAVPLMSSLDPKVPIQLRLSCTSGTAIEVRTDYERGSQCFNQTSNFSVNFQPGWAPAPIAEIGLPDDEARKTAFVVDVPLCAVPEFVFDSNDGWPELQGPSVKFTNIDYDDVCVIDVYSKLPQADASRPIKRLSVEGKVVKTFFIGYYRKRIKYQGVAEAVKVPSKESVHAMYYELDGIRSYAGGRSSVVAISLADTAIDVVEYDMRTWLKAGGIFGTLWYMISAYLCFWAAPLLLSMWPRNIIEEAKAGKLDGYTANALSDCWRPTVWLWIGGELVKRITFATK